MKKFSLTKKLLGTKWISDGVISSSNGGLLKAYSSEFLSSGTLEEGFNGPLTDSYFSKFSELLTRLPNLFEGQVLLVRRKLENAEVPGLTTTLYFFENVQKAESYSHLDALFKEAKFLPEPLTKQQWTDLLVSFLGQSINLGRIPDVTWEKDHLSACEKSIRVLSLTELPQLTWNACLQPIFEYPEEFILSLKINIPDRQKIKKQLETKRRVSHALSISSSLEVKNIESNSVLHSSEETLERILLNKETLFETSLSIILKNEDNVTLEHARDFERVISGIGNAGLFLESIGSLPVFRSHLPGNGTLSIRKLPMLSENLAQIFPIFHEFSRNNDESHLSLRSRTGEVSHLNLFSRENLNYNSFICGASGSGKSFLMNAILASTIADDPKTRLCIFDVGGSYRKIIQANGGKSKTLTVNEANSLIATYIHTSPVTENGFFKPLIETLCGSGSHITHSHKVAIDDLLKEFQGHHLRLGELIKSAKERTEYFYQDIAHWLKPHIRYDHLNPRKDLVELIKSQITAFDFKELDSDPILQKTSILLLTELLWKDLLSGNYSRTLIVFDEVWRFFAQSKGFLEEMYRTLRKYKAGIVSITQNLSDYGDEAFAKMLFTNSFTKIFLQNGAAADFLKDTFDLPDSDIQRALSVTSKKPHYSEFFALTPNMSQVFRLYPTQEFYELANTENITRTNEGD
ncbi:MAG: DUF87 domain-containing protein [Bdellovibrionales bacterium]|nr:DUF87 domain-containing protein [Bdellovibrionales bacterium]